MRMEVKGNINQTAKKVLFFVTRADGKEESYGPYENLFLNSGMDWLAAYQSTSPGSAMNHMAVGTRSTAATLTDVVGSMGEVARKTMASRIASDNILYEVCTFAGAADNITSLSLREVCVVNNATSGPAGATRSRTVFAAIVLANTDFVRVEYQTTCGSR